MDPNKPVVLLALTIFLALGVERLVELCSAVWEHMEAGQDNFRKAWEAKARTLRNRIEVRLNNVRADANPQSALRLVLFVVCRHLNPSGNGLAVSVAEVRKLTLKVGYKLLAMVLGVILAYYFGLNIFELVNDELQIKSDPLAPGWLGVLVTGMAMGLGAGPVHNMIVALENARAKRI